MSFKVPPPQTSVGLILCDRNTKRQEMEVGTPQWKLPVSTRVQGKLLLQEGAVPGLSPVPLCTFPGCWGHTQTDLVVLSAHLSQARLK